MHTNMRSNPGEVGGGRERSFSGSNAGRLGVLRRLDEAHTPSTLAGSSDVSQKMRTSSLEVSTKVLSRTARESGR